MGMRNWWKLQILVLFLWQTINIMDIPCLLPRRTVLLATTLLAMRLLITLVPTMTQTRLPTPGIQKVMAILSQRRMVNLLALEHALPTTPRVMVTRSTTIPTQMLPSLQLEHLQELKEFPTMPR